MANYDLERMLELIAAGKSNRYIAGELGVSIGTVAGRRHRAKYPYEPKTVNSLSAEPVQKVSQVLKIKMVVRAKKKHGPRNLDILSLKSDHCRWPKDGGLFCAATVVLGYSYCHEHCMQSYPMYAAKQEGRAYDRRRTD